MKKKIKPSTNTNLYSFLVYLNDYKVLLFFAVLIFILYMNSLDNSFVSDDMSYLSNPNYMRVPLSDVLAFPHIITNHLVYQVRVLIAGRDPTLLRLFNVLFHTLFIFGFYKLVHFFFKDKRLAFISALILAVHPVLSEVVNWISAYPYSMSSAFFVWSFYYYLIFKETKDIKKYYISLALFLGSLTSFEKYVPLFGFFVAYELFLGDIKKNYKYLIPHLVFGSVLLIKIFGLLDDRVSTIKSLSGSVKGMPLKIVIPFALANYIYIFFYPEKLTFYRTNFDFTYGASLFIFIPLLIFAGYLFLKNRKLFIFFVLFLMSLSAFLTPFGIAWLVAERYVYLGSTFLALSFVYYLLKLQDSFPKLHIPVFILFVLIILALSIRTHIRNNDWQDQDTLWFATVKVSPGSPKVHNNLGDYYVRHKNLKKAIEEFSIAIKLNPRFAEAHYNLGLTLYRLNKLDEAKPYFEKTIKLKPNLSVAYWRLGQIAIKQGNYEEAEKMLLTAIRYNPNTINMWTDLRTLYKLMGNKEKFEEANKRVIELTPVVNRIIPNAPKK